MIGMGKHVKGLEIFNLVSRLEEGSDVSCQNCGITRDVHYNRGSNFDDRSERFFIRPTSWWIEHHTMDGFVRNIFQEIESFFEGPCEESAIVATIQCGVLTRIPDCLRVNIDSEHFFRHWCKVNANSAGAAVCIEERLITGEVRRLKRVVE